MQDEILKHTKKIYKEVKNKNHTFSDKLKEITIEILIIVFAVSLSIALHSWSEKRHQQEDAEKFMLGLKDDLQNDIENLENTKTKLNETHHQIDFVLNLTQEKIDSIKSKKQQVNSGTNFINTISHNARYEGFKSSGKINTIENEALRNKILSYYQQTIPQINEIERSYEKIISRYTDLLLNGDDDIAQTFLKKKTKIILSGINNFTDYNKKFYDDAINNAKEIMNDIDKECQ